MNGVFNIIPIWELFNEPSVEPSEVFSNVKLIHKTKSSHVAIWNYQTTLGKTINKLATKNKDQKRWAPRQRRQKIAWWLQVHRSIVASFEIRVSNHEELLVKVLMPLATIY